MRTIQTEPFHAQAAAQDASKGVLVWKLDEWVGIGVARRPPLGAALLGARRGAALEGVASKGPAGNALDSFARAVIEAAHQGRRLEVRSRILAKFCAATGGV